ncbi:hypothetical protein [Dyella sp. 2RAB6]|uniref:hypothetical protein n=1 Tax=Dyella sp. 2RAB6 TaxID=3232992 RepID=UPI003F8D9FFC
MTEPDRHPPDLLRELEALRLRLDALDVVATGICEGMRLNVLQPDAAYQLLDMISSDLKARTDKLVAIAT